MEPLSALSLAGNVIQLVDFGLRIVSKGNQIYHSGEGVLSEDHDLEVVTNDLLVICTRLHRSVRTQGWQTPPSEEDQALEELCRISNELATKLLERLNMAKAQGRFRRWKSIRQALKSVWSKRDVDDMARRLEMLRNGVNSRILVSLREKVNEFSVQQAGFRDFLRRSPNINSTEAGHNIGGTWQHSVKGAEILRTGTDQCPEFPDWRQTLSTSSTVPNAQIARVNNLTYQESHPLYDLAPFPGLYLPSVEKAILRSFEFPNMCYRHQAIVSAHAKTFEWIFNNSEANQMPWDNFSEWLQYRNHIYWITGKAASGKSTLMKYIFEQPRLWKFLKIWAGDAKLICANFYFWHLGSQMQRSQAGLLRSLLHQIFSQCGDLIPRHLSKLWRRVVFHPRSYFYLPETVLHDESVPEDESTSCAESTSGTRSTHHRKSPRLSKQLIFTDQYLDTLQENWYPWSLEQAASILEEVIMQTTIPLTFCFFVDGLDEFDGDHSEIAALFHRVAALSNVKICLSSRPLLVFQQEFESCARLRVHELTKNDIRLYAHDKLSTHRRVLELSNIQPSLLSRLTSEVMTMSCGVFLWVTLAIRSLLSGLTNLDDITDLQRRLHELPPELDDMFCKMLLSVKPEFYRGQAARLFQLVYQSASPVSALALSFADEVHKDSTQWIKPNPVDVLEAARRVKAISARLQSRSAGLLEVCWDGNTGISSCNMVQYLHLTVKDFLAKPRVWTDLLQLTTEMDWDANVSLLRSNVLMLRWNTLDNRFQGWQELTWSLIDQAMMHALQAENSTGKAQVALLDELDRIATQVQKRSSSLEAADMSQQKLHWSALMHPRDQPCCKCPESFLTFAITRGLTFYVRAKVGSCITQVDKTAKQPFLNYATFYHATYCDGKETVIHLQMLALLLRGGVDPNEDFNGGSPWKNILSHLLERSQKLHLKLEPWCLDTCKLFLLYGADPHACVSGLSVLEIFERTFPNLSEAVVQAMLIPKQPLSWKMEASSFGSELSNPPGDDKSSTNDPRRHSWEAHNWHKSKPKQWDIVKPRHRHESEYMHLDYEPGVYMGRVPEYPSLQAQHGDYSSTAQHDRYPAINQHQQRPPERRYPRPYESAYIGGAGRGRDRLLGTARCYKGRLPDTSGRTWRQRSRRYRLSMT